MATLYELTGEYQELLSMLEDPDADLQTITDTLEGISGEIEIKAEAIAKICKELEGREDIKEQEANRLLESARHDGDHIGWLKDYLKNCMEITGKRKFKTNLFSFGIRKAPARVVLDTETVPEQYLVPQSPKVDRKAIAADLKAGTAPDGVAHLEQSEYLSIR